MYEGDDFFRLLVVATGVAPATLARLGGGWSQVEAGGTTGERRGGFLRWVGRVGVAWRPFHWLFT